MPRQSKMKQVAAAFLSYTLKSSCETQMSQAFFETSVKETPIWRILMKSYIWEFIKIW